MDIRSRSTRVNRFVVRPRLKCSVAGLALAVLISALPSTNARAATVVPRNASFSGTVSLFNEFVFGAPPATKTISTAGTVTDSIDIHNEHGGFRKGTVTLAATPQPKVTLDFDVVNSPGDGPDNSLVKGGIAYDFVVNGLAGTIVPVSLTVAWSMDVFANRSQLPDVVPFGAFSRSSGFLEFRVEPYITGDEPSTDIQVSVDSDHPGVAHTVCGGPDVGLCSAGGVYQGTIHFDVRANDRSPISMFMSLSNQYGGHGHGFIDPVIAIDPAFLATHPGFSLSISDGIGNSPSAVPLPAALWLFGPALAVCGTKRRRVIG